MKSQWGVNDNEWRVYNELEEYFNNNVQYKITNEITSELME